MPVNLDSQLIGVRVAITRPVGSGAALARRVRAFGGEPLLLPGSRLRAADDARTARAALREALTTDVTIFTSPAAVRFSTRLCDLHTRAHVLAPGSGTMKALRRAGIQHVLHHERENSEGLLALPILRNVRGKRIGIIGAAGGRGLLERELAARGATVLHAHVYRRTAARLDRRHVQALLRDPREPLFVLLTSAQAIANILDKLPADACHTLLDGTAVVSSERLAGAAHTSGFARLLRAASAHGDALLAAIVADRS